MFFYPCEMFLWRYKKHVKESEGSPGHLFRSSPSQAFSDETFVHLSDFSLTYVTLFFFFLILLAKKNSVTLSTQFSH